MSLDPGTGDPGAGHPVYGHPVYGHPVYGHPVYGRPTLGELVAAVREALSDAVAGPALSGFGARVAANVLGIVERELARGPADQRAYDGALGRLGAVDEAALAAEIRSGRRDHQLDEIAREFRGIVAARLAVAHPGYATALTDAVTDAAPDPVTGGVRGGVTDATEPGSGKSR